MSLADGRPVRRTSRQPADLPSVVTITANAIRLKVRVQPRASRDRVVGVHGEALKLQVTAPPVEGAANAAVAALVAEWLGVPRRSARVVQGLSSREKVVEVTTDQPAALAARAADLAAGCVDKGKGRD